MERDEHGGSEDLSCIHWGYLNVLQLSDVAGKKVKRYVWQTFWTDLCGSTLRLYKDTSLPSDNKKDFPPSTMIGPRPEDQIKHAFFSLKHGTVKDFDSNEYVQKLHKKVKVPSLVRKNTLEIILSDSSVYLLQAPTMSALYRWRTKIQSSIDNADAPEKLYDKQLRDAKMTMYERRRCFVSPEPTYPEAANQVIDDDEEEYLPAERPSCDPQIKKLKEKLLEKKHLLNQLEKQEEDFLGIGKENHDMILRVEFEATAKKDYFLVPGRTETLIPAGRKFTVFGQLGNKRWRCFVDRDDEFRISRLGSEKPEIASEKNGEAFIAADGHLPSYSYPLIGSVPTSAILELTLPGPIKDMIDSLSVSSGDTTSDVSLPETPPGDTAPTSPSFALATDPFSEPYSNHKPSSRSGLSLQSSTASDNSSMPTTPENLNPVRSLEQLSDRGTLPSEASTLSPTSPQLLPDTPSTQSVEAAMSELNRALENLALISSRSRLSSQLSTCSRASTSSQEDDDMADMSRGSRLELVSDENVPYDDSQSAGEVRRRKKRDIQISRKLHARGISLIVGSSSSSEDEDDRDQGMKETDKKENNHGKFSPARKIEELHASKEQLTEKVLKVPKSITENTSKPPGDRQVLEKPTTNHDLLREFSDNSYGLPVRNSVTQAQFKPLASHEIPPPLHQRRTLQMTRKENEGFGFVLQTHSVVQSGVYHDSMTFVSNVSEDGPAYLAGMRPGDIIIEVENVTVEDEDQRMIVERIKNCGLTVRLVVVFKDAIRRMRLATRLVALKARLQEAEAAYEALESKERMIEGRVKDPSDIDIKVRIALIHIHIQTSSSTFARESPMVRNSVVQNKKTPTELLQSKQPPLSNTSRICGVPTTGFGLVREFASTCETENLERHQRATSPKYASDTALNTTKKRKTSEGSAKQKTLRKPQRSSFISYVEFEEKPLNDLPRRRIKSERDEPEDELETSNVSVETDEKPSEKSTCTTQPSPLRPESYMFAVGSDSIGTYTFKGSKSSRLQECFGPGYV